MTETCWSLLSTSHMVLKHIPQLLEENVDYKNVNQNVDFFKANPKSTESDSPEVKLKNCIL